MNLATERVNDIGNFMDNEPSERIAQQITADIRSALIDTNSRDVQTHLWRRRNTTQCALEELAAGVTTGSALDCMPRPITLNDITQQTIEGDYFVSSLPNVISTGVVSQYAPGMHSTVSFAETSLPAECEPDGDNAFYVSYSSSSEAESDWTMTACIPDYPSEIIQPTRDRQTFRETAYITFDDGDAVRSEEITVETTMGYFELPRHGNFEEPGPIMETDPLVSSSHIGPCQTWDCSRTSSSFRRRDLTRTQGPNQADFQNLENKGPLGYFTTALFGHGSYIHMLNYTAPLPLYTSPTNSTPTTSTIARRPLLGLLRSTTNLDCTRYLNDTSLSTSDDPAGEELRCIASLFFHDGADTDTDTDITEQMLRGAMVLAGQAILTKESTSSSLNDQLRIHADGGMEYLRPTMGFAGLIILSILHAILVASLLGLPIYTAVRYGSSSSEPPRRDAAGVGGGAGRGAAAGFPSGDAAGEGGTEMDRLSGQGQRPLSSEPGGAAAAASRQAGQI